MAAIKEETASSKRGAGKPFEKGQSGNPSGRPKRTEEELDLIAACKEKTPAALAVIESVMLEGQNERNRLAAAQYVIDRGYGKPVQQSEITGANGGPIDMNWKIEFVEPKNAG